MVINITMLQFLCVLLCLLPGAIQSDVVKSLVPFESLCIPIAENTALLLNIPPNATWTQDGVTIAGGLGPGHATNQLTNPQGLAVDDDETVFIADYNNARIMSWKTGATTGEVVAGGQGAGNGLNQLYWPTDVIVDKETNSLIICDRGNRRVMRWYRQSGTTSGTIMIDNIACYGLTMDNQRYLYVTTDEDKQEVRRYDKGGDTKGTLVAGGNGKGDDLNQLNGPVHIVVDGEQSVYVSDWYNHRVMKWMKDAKEGIVVAGGQGVGSDLTQLAAPRGLLIDGFGTVYVAEWANHRVTRWYKGEKQGTVIVSGNRWDNPEGLSFDRHGNLYVGDTNYHRVQRYSIKN